MSQDNIKFYFVKEPYLRALANSKIKNIYGNKYTFINEKKKVIQRPFMGPFELNGKKYYIPLTSSMYTSKKEEKVEGKGFSIIGDKNNQATLSGLCIANSLQIPEEQLYGISDLYMRESAKHKERFDAQKNWAQEPNNISQTIEKLKTIIDSKYWIEKNRSSEKDISLDFCIDFDKVNSEYEKFNKQREKIVVNSNAANTISKEWTLWDVVKIALDSNNERVRVKDTNDGDSSFVERDVKEKKKKLKEEAFEYMASMEEAFRNEIKMLNIFFSFNRVLCEKIAQENFKNTYDLLNKMRLWLTSLDDDKKDFAECESEFIKEKEEINKSYRKDVEIMLSYIHPSDRLPPKIVRLMDSIVTIGNDYYDYIDKIKRIRKSIDGKGEFSKLCKVIKELEQNGKEIKGKVRDFFNIVYGRIPIQRGVPSLSERTQEAYKKLYDVIKENIKKASSIIGENMGLIEKLEESEMELKETDNQEKAQKNDVSSENEALKLEKKSENLLSSIKQADESMCKLMYNNFSTVELVSTNHTIEKYSTKKPKNKKKNAKGKGNNKANKKKSETPIVKAMKDLKKRKLWNKAIVLRYNLDVIGNCIRLDDKEDKNYKNNLNQYEEYLNDIIGECKNLINEQSLTESQVRDEQYSVINDKFEKYYKKIDEIKNTEDEGLARKLYCTPLTTIVVMTASVYKNGEEIISNNSYFDAINNVIESIIKKRKDAIKYIDNSIDKITDQSVNIEEIRDDCKKKADGVSKGYLKAYYNNYYNPDMILQEINSGYDKFVKYCEDKMGLKKVEAKSKIKVCQEELNLSAELGIWKELTFTSSPEGSTVSGSPIKNVGGGNNSRLNLNKKPSFS